MSDNEDFKRSKEDFATEEEFYEKFPGAFRKGVSGNPAGRPKEASNRKTVRKIAEEMGFCPVTTAIDLIQMSTTQVREKYKLHAGDSVSAKDKAKLAMWIGDKMHASLRSVDYAVLEPPESGSNGVLQIILPAKAPHHMPTHLPIDVAPQICVAQDPIPREDDDE